MREMEKDLGRPLQWVAIDHHNTDPHLHVHVCLRGRDRNGQELQIAKDYLWGGLMWRAGEVLTWMLGWKLAPELADAAQRAVRERRYGQHDRSLARKLDHNQEVQRQHLTPRTAAPRAARRAGPRVADRHRLATCPSLAGEIENGTGTRTTTCATARQRTIRAASRPAENRKEQERAQEREREEAEERQRRIRTIDQLEQEWGR